MILKRFHLGLRTSDVKLLEKLAAKLGLDKTSAIRYCISRVAEQEGITKERSGESGAKR